MTYLWLVYKQLKNESTTPFIKPMTVSVKLFQLNANVFNIIAQIHRNERSRLKLIKFQKKIKVSKTKLISN